MTKVHLHGKLGKQFGKTFELAVSSPQEAVKALCTTLRHRNFKQEFEKNDYQIYLGEKSENNYIDLNSYNFNSSKDIHIVPRVAGAKNTKTGGKTLAGIALTTVGFITANPALVSAGISMTLGGAAQLLAPKVGKDNTDAIKNFDGTPDSVQEGGCVPLVYGRFLAEGFPISFYVDTGLNPFSSSTGSTYSDWNNIDVSLET